jgi:hypothetical protein
MKNEFIPGRLYESENSNTVVKCISDKGENSYNFTGVVVSSSEYPIGDVSNEWNRNAFELIKSVEEPILNVIL